MEPTKDQKIKNYADGWITEREGTEVPGFLKLAFPVIALGSLAYFIVYMYGETTHADRGHLVQAMNAATEASGTLMYAVAAMILIFGIVVVVFSFGKSHE